MQQKWCLYRDESGKDDGQPRKEGFIQTCKRNGRGGKNQQLRWWNRQRLGFSSTWSSILSEMLRNLDVNSIYLTDLLLEDLKFIISPSHTCSVLITWSTAPWLWWIFLCPCGYAANRKMDTPWRYSQLNLTLDYSLKWELPMCFNLRVSTGIYTFTIFTAKLIVYLIIQII